MTKLPQLKPTEVIKGLENLGFRRQRIRGSHLRLIHPDGRGATVALHNQPVPKGTLKSILRQAQISTQQLLANL